MQTVYVINESIKVIYSDKLMEFKYEIKNYVFLLKITSNKICHKHV